MKAAILILYLVFLCTPMHAAGSDYFQQEVRYKINVTLDDVKNALFGDETIFYKNNSAQSLSEIYLHIWPAAYSGNSTALARELFSNGDDRMLSAQEKDLGNIHSLDFSVNGEKAQWKKVADTVDVCMIRLSKPLDPGDSLVISTPFRVKIPASYFSRLGHTNQAYYITQWYPKLAVFDENGWNYFPYFDQGEYYGEFGVYDVFITLPENYVLGATGVRVGAEKEISWLNQKDSLTRSMDRFPATTEIPKSSTNFKTVHFRQDRVHDFAWFADKRWYVLKDTCTLKSTGKKIITWSFFTHTEAEYWKRTPSYLDESLQWFSSLIGEYPYSEMTAVDVGNAPGGGMEYPMITPIGNYGSDFELEQTIFHEVAHNWFYGILANNERCQPLLDEGLTTYYETRFVYSKYKNDSSKQIDTSPYPDYYFLPEGKTINHRLKKMYRYLGQARINQDESPNQCADQFNNENYRSDVYSKSTICFDYLNFYLGDSLFDKCIQAYYEQWKFRHPRIKDLREIFETTSGKNLSWFFNDLLSSTHKLNYKICQASVTENGNVRLTLSNKGRVASPLSISGLQKGKVIYSFWTEGFEGKKDTVLNCNGCDEITLDAGKRMPELYRSDNQIRLKGIMKKIEKPHLSPGIRIEDESRTQLFYLPIIGWNNYNKVMPGVLLHNISFHEKKIEFRLMPLYSTATKNLCGGGDVSYHIYPKHSRFSRVTLKTGISHYAFFHDSYENNVLTYSNINRFFKSDSRILFDLRKKNPRKMVKNSLSMRAVYLIKDLPYAYHYKKSKFNKLFGQLEFIRINSNPLEKSLGKLTITYNDEFLGAFAEAKKFFVYNSAKKGFEARLFIGYIHTSNPTLDYRMSLDGSTGDRDYLFDEVFIGRTEESGVLSHQHRSDYAGFQTPTSFYRLAEQWMSGLNVNSTLPGLIPLRVFANAGSFDNADLNGTNGKISWEVGIDLPIIKDVFVISYPLAYSDDIKYAVDQQDLKKGNLIRFELHLRAMDPFNFVKAFYNK